VFDQLEATMGATSSQESVHFRPWLTVWLHPRQTIQKIVDVKPLHRIYLLMLLSGVASGVGGWLNAVMMDSDNFQENVFLSAGYSLVVGTATALAFSLVLQWIAGLGRDRIPYAHLVAAYYWGTVPEIGFLLLFIVVFLGGVLASMLLPSVGGARTDLLLVFAWLAATIWSTVLTVGALAQVMKCSVSTAIGRFIGTGLALVAPVWALNRLVSFFGDSYSGDGDRVIYQRPGTEPGTDPASLVAPTAVLVVSLIVFYAMYRASRSRSAAASSDSQKDEADPAPQISE
jgi:hypothetical protein